jgi:hypothetical protein
MNEVNIKYWFRESKNFFYRFYGRIRTFNRRKTDFYVKKHSVALPSTVISWLSNENFVRPIFERNFQVRDFFFWITEGIGLTGVSFHFWTQKQIPSGSSHTNFWVLFHFNVKYWPILMFLSLIWCKILCWAYGV